MLASEDKKIRWGFAVEPRLGFSAQDDARLQGMARRRDNLEGGLPFGWDFDVSAVSGAYFGGPSLASHGHSTWNPQLDGCAFLRFSDKASFGQHETTETALCQKKQHGVNACKGAAKACNHTSGALTQKVGVQTAKIFKLIKRILIVISGQLRIQGSIRAAILKPLFKDDKRDIGALRAFDAMTTDIANYYFGVRATAAYVSQSAYLPAEATGTAIGTRGTDQPDKRRELMFDAIVTRLPARVAVRPIVQTDVRPRIRVGALHALRRF